MKANATGSKTTTIKVAATKVKTSEKIDVPAVVVPAKAIRRSPAKVDVALPIGPPTQAEPIGTSKQARLITMLKASSGATLEQMMTLTGWQAHTVRGAISGVLRKRLGLNVVCDAAGSEVRRYRIVGSVGV
ncbi:MAG: DUF3489 domain-containing protein [Burkholderiales bacterium]